MSKVTVTHITQGISVLLFGEFSRKSASFSDLQEGWVYRGCGSMSRRPQGGPSSTWQPPPGFGDASHTRWAPQLAPHPSSWQPVPAPPGFGAPVHSNPHAGRWNVWTRESAGRESQVLAKGGTALARYTAAASLSEGSRSRFFTLRFCFTTGRMTVCWLFRDVQDDKALSRKPQLGFAESWSCCIGNRTALVAEEKAQQFDWLFRKTVDKL